MAKSILSTLKTQLSELKRKHLVVVLAIAIGLLSGVFAVFLKWSVSSIREILTSGSMTQTLGGLYVIYPLLGIGLTVFLVKRVIRKKLFSGIPSTLYSISKKRSNVKTHNLYSSLVTSIFTAGFGGSAGLEGPLVQTNAAWGSNLGRLFKVDYKTKTLLIGCAAAAAMAAIFKAPLAAVVFAVEVLMLEFSVSSLIPLLVASISAVMVTSFYGGDDSIIRFNLLHEFQLRETGYFILLGLLTGLSSVYFSRLYMGITSKFQSIKNWKARALSGGILLGVIVWIFPPLYGEGYEILNQLISDNGYNQQFRGIAEDTFFGNWTESGSLMLLFLFCLVLFKVIATSLTIGSGGIGGVFAPSLFMGGTLGFFFSRFFKYYEINTSLPSENFTLVGMAGLMAGVLHAPLTAIFMIAEVAGGYGLYIPLMLTAATSYYVSKSLMSTTIYTRELAQRGELITHDKDDAAMTLMNLEELISTDFKTFFPDQLLKEVKMILEQTDQLLYPVVDKYGNLLGQVTIDDLRPILFKPEVFSNAKIADVLSASPEVISVDDDIKDVMQKFEDTEAWKLPVVNHTKYVGVISRTQLLTAYREEIRSSQFED
ncbi:MAG: chloride channel protein [Flavobacteriales bacterium]